MKALSLILSVLILAFAGSAQADPGLEKIRTGPHDHFYRIVFDLTDPVPTTVADRNDRRYVDVILQAKLDVRTARRLEPENSHIQEIRLLRQSDNATTYRISYQDVGQVKWESGGNKVVVDLYYTGSKKKAEAPVQEKTHKPKPRVKKPVLTEEVLSILSAADLLALKGHYPVAARMCQAGYQEHKSDTLAYTAGRWWIRSGQIDRARLLLDPLSGKTQWAGAIQQLYNQSDNGSADQNELEAYYLGLIQRAKVKTTPPDNQQTSRVDTVWLTAESTDTRMGSHFLPGLFVGLLVSALGLGGYFLFQRRRSLDQLIDNYPSGQSEQNERTQKERPLSPDPEPDRPEPQVELPNFSEAPPDIPLPDSPPPPPPPKPQDNKDLPPPMPENGTPDTEVIGSTRDQEVYRLADKEKSIVEIAETLGLSQDEVKLILELRERSQQLGDSF